MRFLTLIVLTLLWYTGITQSYFYNTQQFGLQSTLLGGAVTAGSSDLSMVYYNPAALRYAKGKGFDLALFMPSWNVNNYGDFFNSGNDLKSTELSLNPSLITYKTSIKDFSIVFCILQKDVWDNEVSYNEIKTKNFFDQNESFSYSYTGDETWFGVGTNFILSDMVSMGISQFWSAHSTNYDYHISSEIITQSGIRSDFFNKNLALDYRSLFAMVTKIGFSFDRPEDRIGMVITTPYYLPARLSANFDQSTATLESGIYTLDNIVDFDLQPNLKSSWQIDLGYAKIFRDSSEIWLNGSIHSGVSDHEVLKVERIRSNPLLFSRGLAPTANFSLGHARFISPNIQFIGSIRTNFNAYDGSSPETESENIIILDEDRMQVAFGCKVRHKNSSFVVGLDWGFSLNNNVSQFERFPNIDRFDTRMAEYGHQSLTFLLTYEFFIDSVTDNLSKMLSPSN